jgi:GPH family glycoside/pentoside/hexuronide:cation symporter
MSDDSSAKFTAAHKPTKLDLYTKLTFGIGTIGTASTNSILAFFLMFFLTDVAGLPAALAGSVLMVGQISDAISDPVIGLLSDKTQSRWGRRYPWIVGGAIPFGISFFLLWVIPTSQIWPLFAYYVMVGIVFKTALTSVYLPYVSLTPELTQDYDDRTSLNSFRLMFSIGSSILGLVMVSAIFNLIENPVQQHLVVGLVGGLLCITSMLICVAGTYRRVRAIEQQQPQNRKPVSLTLVEQVRIAFSNRPFVLVIGIYLCSWISAQMTAVIMKYFVVSWMELPSGVFTQFALAVQGTALLMLFVWSWVSRRLGKRAVYFMGTSLWIIAQAGLFFLQPGQITLMFILGIMAGFGVSTAYLVPWSMLPDVVELDELRTGQRREGVFYAFMVMLQKVGLAIAVFMVGQSLSWAGYIESSSANGAEIVQPESALFVIRLAIGPIAALLLVVGLGIAYFYPITREVHAEILMALRKRRTEGGEQNEENWKGLQ